MTDNGRRVRAFHGDRAEERAERAGHWLKALAGSDASRKWCIENRMPLTKASNESVNTAGGFLVPIELDEAIIRVVETLGAFRNADMRPARSDNKIRPRRVNGLVASFVSEGDAIPESSFQLDAVGAALKKMAILARLSSEVFEDSEPDVAELVAVEAGYAFAGLEDDCGFNGDGTSTYRGISGLSAKLASTKSSIAAASGHSTFLTLDATDIGNLMAGVLATAIPGAKWYVSAVAYAQTFCRLAAVSGGLTATMRPDGTINANYLGFPVVFSGKLPNSTSSLSGKAMIFFGNLAMASTIVEKSDATIIATSFDRALDSADVLIRGVRREDIICHMGVSDITTATGSYAPIAMLTGTS